MKYRKQAKNRNSFPQTDHIKLGEDVLSFDWSKFEKFDDIPISNQTKNGLRKSGYITPTDIQRQSIGYALCGNDVLGAAKTGSGKSLSFLIPMLECLYRNQWTSFDGVGALIISPTRELSYQIFEVLKGIGGEHDFSAGLIIGGKDLKFESRRMDRCNIIVCTPGRLLQHMDQNPLFNCDNLKMLILDEADRILDQGFAETMNAIIENLPKTRQTLLFSATQTKSVKALARLSLNNPIYISSHENEKHSTPENLNQSYIICALEDKLNLLWSFVKQHKQRKIIVFLSTCKQVKFVYDLFCHLRPGIPLLALYGTLHQERRMSIYDKFCDSQRMVLFATDIASRGLDFPKVDWVVQLDCPEDVNTYIHRVGRTARLESEGESLLVLLPSEENGMIQHLREKKVPIDKIQVNPKMLSTIHRKTEASLAQYVSLKESAQRAFKAYLKNVFLMKDKSIFQYDQLNLDAFAKSFGLLITPRVRFIERKVKKGNLQAIAVVKENEPESSEPEIDNFVREPINSSDNTAINCQDNDLFQVKKVWRFDQDEHLDSTIKAIQPDKSKKVLSKAALTKRLLKKNIKLNTKIVFDDESNAIIDGFPNKQTSEYVKELDEVVSGIDINIAKKIMEDEDKIDKKLYREVVKEKHLKKKMKLKSMKRKDKEMGQVELDLGEDDQEELEDDEKVTQHYIDALPDPDRIYGQSEELEETSHQESDSQLVKTESLSVKRVCPDNPEKFKTKKKKLTKQLDVNYYEEMASKLLDI